MTQRIWSPQGLVKGTLAGSAKLRRTLGLLSIMAAMSLAGGCFRDDPAAPATRSQPRFSGESVGTASIPIPPVNDPYNGQVDWFDTGIIIPEEGYYRTTVTGTVTTSPNPGYELCLGQPWPYPGATYGPLGLPGSSDLQVALWYDYTYSAIGLTGPEGGTTATNVANLPAGTHLLAMRSGIAGGGSNGATGCVAPGWALSGAQAITVEKLPPVTVHATKNPVTAGEAVTFVAAGPVELYSGFWWVYSPFDTLATPSGAPNDHIWPCEGKATCTISVPASGRMYLNKGTAYSEIVWVKSPSVRLALSCTPSEVPVGATTTCTASTAPAGEALQVVEWFFVPDSATQDKNIQSLECAAENPCTTHIPDNGTVYVRATVAGIDQTAGAPVTRARPKLEVMASATLVHPGDTVTFTAQAPGASSVQVDSPWVWVAGAITTAAPVRAASARPAAQGLGLRATAIAEAQTTACPAGVNTCTASINETGRFQVWATVDGEQQYAESPVVEIDSSGSGGGTDPDSTGGDGRVWVHLSCPDSVTTGNFDRCTFTATAGADVTLTFIPDNFIAIITHPHAADWSGQWVTSGMIGAVAALNGTESPQDTEYVAVKARRWQWDTSLWITSSGDLPRTCFPNWSYPIDTVAVGATARGDCSGMPLFPTRSEDGFSPDSGSGPNEGFHYVRDRRYFIELHTALNPWLQQDGPSFPVPADQSKACARYYGSRPDTMNMDQFNNVCKSNTDWRIYLDSIMVHEGRHLQLARASAIKPGNDLYAALDSVVTQSDLALYEEVNNIYEQISSRMNTDMNVIDNPHVSSGWQGIAWFWDVVQMRFIDRIVYSSK